MKDIKEKTHALIGKYAPMLKERGIAISVRKRYFESEVNPKFRTTGTGSLLDIADKAIAHRREKKKYFFEKNKYHCIILSVMPDGNTSLKKERCKEYAVVLKKVERAYEGEKPRHFIYEEEKLLKKVENCILKILKKAEKKAPEKVCKDGFSDVLRYLIRPKYGYKKSVLGRSFFTWDMMIAIAIIVICIAIILLCFIIGKLRGHTV